MSLYNENSALFEDSQICVKTELVFGDDGDNFDMVDADSGLEVVKVETIKSEEVDESTKDDSMILFNELVLKCEPKNETQISDIEESETDSSESVDLETVDLDTDEQIKGT